jgi:DNA-binding transcriptional regulator YiaG
MGEKKVTWKVRVEALLSKVGSVESLAGKLGVSYFTVLRWRTGKVRPSVMGQRLIKLEESAGKASE